MVATRFQLADVNLDGKPDLLLSNNNSDRVGILLGNGEGTFSAQRTVLVFASPLLYMADLNNDGSPDMVAENPYSNLVTTFLGNGDGKFRLGRTFALGSRPTSLVPADLNGDGFVDLVAANDGDLDVSVLLGNGDGGFGPQKTYAISGGTGNLEVRDLNGDGTLDVVCGLSVLPGNGDGTFGSRIDLISREAGVQVEVTGDGRTDEISVGGNASGYVRVTPGGTAPTFVGDTYTIIPLEDTINFPGSSIVLERDADQTHIDWTIGTMTSQMSINDPNGLTILGDQSSLSPITLDYTNGNPLPNLVHLNGTFTIRGLQGASPLAATTLDINRSTVFIDYGNAGADAAMKGLITQYLASGYNGGAWSGSAAVGIITSAAAAGNLNHNTAIGWADWADGTGVNPRPNTIELKYTLVGDVNLDGAVNITDVNALVPHYNSTGSWTGGDFNYDGLVNITDVNALVPNYNTLLGSQVQGASVSASGAGEESNVAAAAAVYAGGTSVVEADPLGKGALKNKRRH